LNAEEKFLGNLETLHRAFPKLRIVLEHASTKAAVDMVCSLGDTVGCTITVHHLWLTVEDWAGQPHAFCKPVAKYYTDREALREIIRKGHPRFFLGTDSAPHIKRNKESEKAPAGVFTSLMPLQYLAYILADLKILDKLENFACVFGRQFYGLELPSKRTVTLTNGVSNVKNSQVPENFPIHGLVNEVGQLETVVPFMANKQLGWTVSLLEF
jgi:dihydroorotase